MLLEGTMDLIINYYYYSTLLIGRYAKAAHILHVSRSYFFLSFLYSTIRLIFVSCLHRH